MDCGALRKPVALSRMPSTRSMAGELKRLLAAVAAPIYFLDRERRVVYCNAACANWIGLEPEEFIDQQCSYHSSPTADRLSRAVAGLCPPPEVYSGERVTGTVTAGTVTCQRADGTLSRRQAEFIPLADSGDEVEGLIAIVALNDLPAASVDATSSVAVANGLAADESVALHERLQQLHHELRRHLAIDRLLGDSAAMARVRAQVQLVAGGDAAVLVVGRRGSGRQHVARAIHDDRVTRDGRLEESSGTFLPLSCEVLGAELLQSTLTALLGPQRVAGQPPATLLLNDVHELPPEVQTVLVGALKNRSSRLRIISTTITPLDELAAAGKFQHELACALSTIVIHLPALADRPDDIPRLAQMFLEELNASNT